MSITREQLKTIWEDDQIDEPLEDEYDYPAYLKPVHLSYCEYRGCIREFREVYDRIYNFYSDQRVPF